jgi:hypothetical protein
MDRTTITVVIEEALEEWVVAMRKKHNQTAPFAGND